MQKTIIVLSCLALAPHAKRVATPRKADLAASFRPGVAFQAPVAVSLRAEYSRGGAKKMEATADAGNIREELDMSQQSARSRHRTNWALKPSRRQTMVFAAALLNLSPTLMSLPAHAAAINTTESSSGIRWGDYQTGTGPAPQKGSKVEIDYMLSPRAGDKMYSTKDSGETYRWTLGDESTINGIEMAIIGTDDIPPMRLGGVRRISITNDDLGYGKSESTIEREKQAASKLGEIVPSKFTGKGPRPPQKYKWTNRNGDKVESYKVFESTFLNENRFDRVDITFDIILKGGDFTGGATLAQTPYDMARARRKEEERLAKMEQPILIKEIIMPDRTGFRIKK